MKNVININDDSFERVTGQGITLVDFWAPWCRPCVMQGPILEKVAAKVGDNANICKLNVEENIKTPGKFGITGIPTMILFKNGQVVNQFVGLQDEDTLVSAVESQI